MQILIIEDDEMWIPILAAMVKKAGHDPILPGKILSVAQAVASIRKYNADIILLDMNYGDKTRMDQSADGCLVVQALNTETRQKIICASSTPEEYIQFLRPLGVQHFGGKKKFQPCLSRTCGC